MNINFNFNYSKNLKINGDIRYQIDTPFIKKINSKLIWEEKFIGFYQLFKETYQ